MKYTFLRGFMRFMTRTYLVGLFTVEGRENVPRAGGLIVCPNHFATLDPPMVPAFLPRSDSWSMAKFEYFRKGWMRWLFTAYHSFSVVRHTADRVALRRSFDLLQASPGPGLGSGLPPQRGRLLADRWSRPVVLDQAAERWVEARVECFLEGLGRQPGRLLAVVGEVDQPCHQRPGV